MKDIKKVFGHRLKALRRSKGLTQERLAEVSGLSYKFIGEIERGNGNPTIDTIGKIATALGIPAAQLLSDRKDEEDWLCLVNRHELLTLKKAAQILTRIFGNQSIS